MKISKIITSTIGIGCLGIVLAGTSSVFAQRDYNQQLPKEDRDRDHDRDGDGIISRRLRNGESATVIAPNRRGEFLRHEFVCTSEGAAGLITNYTCIQYNVDAFNKAFRLNQQTIFSDGRIVETTLADNVNQDWCLKRAAEMRAQDRK